MAEEVFNLGVWSVSEGGLFNSFDDRFNSHSGQDGGQDYLPLKASKLSRILKIRMPLAQPQG